MRRLAAEESVPALAREMLDVLAGQLEAVNAKLKGIEARLMAWHRRDQTSQCLATIPGIGPIGGVSFALKIPQAKAFRSGRHFAAWIGITPRENSTAGKHRPGKISRAGDESLRRGGRARRHRGHPAGQDGPRLAVAVGIAGAQAKEAGRGRAGQQDGPHHLGHDGERRDLPASQGGLSPPATDTWHIGSEQGQRQQDGDRSIRGSGHSGESVGAQTSRSCLEPDPRNPSGPAVNPTAQQRPDI